MLMRRLSKLGALLVIAAMIAVGQAKEESQIVLTVYEDLALVQELRTLTVAEGEGVYSLGDISPKIVPASVNLQPLNAEIALLEASFEYDPISTERLLDEYIGKEIEVLAQESLGVRVYRGVLLSTVGGIILQDEAGRVHVILNPQRITFPKLPDFVAKPALMLTLQSEGAGEFKARLAYLTEGLGWKALYTAVLSEDEVKMNLNSWVSITNNTGLTYKGAKVAVVAGKLQRAEEKMVFRRPGLERAALAEAPTPERKELFEFHLYALPRPLTLKDGKTKQISFITADAVPITKSYIYEGQVLDGVQVRLAFENKEESGLGQPLPAGLLRLYKQTEEGLQFIGEDFINHTPKGEKVTLKAGIAFDLVAERKQTEHTVLGEGRYRASFEIKLRNRKDEDVTITVIEHPQGDWKLIESEPEFTKTDANTIEAKVFVAAGEETIVRYTVEYRF